MLTKAAKGPNERVAGTVAGVLVVAASGVLGAAALPVATLTGVTAALAVGRSRK